MQLNAEGLIQFFMIYRYCTKNLLFVPVLKQFAIFVSALLIFFGSVIALTSYFGGYYKGYHFGKTQLSEEERAIILQEQDKFSPEKFKEYLLELNVRFPHIVYAQAKMESAHFSSPVYKNNHNLFGMKEAKTRPTTAIGTEMGHALYRNWRDSALDYALYQAAFLRNATTEEEYYKYLSASYAEKSYYVAEVKKIADSLKVTMFN